MEAVSTSNETGSCVPREEGAEEGAARRACTVVEHSKRLTHIQRLQLAGIQAMSKQPSSIDQSIESAKTFADKSKNSDDVHVTTSEEGTTPSTLDQPRSDSTTEGDAYYPEGKSSYVLKASYFALQPAAAYMPAPLNCLCSRDASFDIGLAHV
ncbi:hypothetical protein ABBQ38_007897 [Trebouxia sp. C0009 RCD-2024]